MRKALAPALVAGAAMLAPSVASADRPTSPGCRTKACAKRVCTTNSCRGRVASKRRARAMRSTRPALASWYGPGLYGNPLGCGGRLYAGTLGVAHKSLPCGTRVRVCKARCLTVRVIDRGPYVGGREFDLTAATAQAIGHVGVGTIRVAIG